MGETGREPCGCKVGRVSEQYGLADLDAELRRRRREDDESLRDLASYVNRRVVAAELDDVDAIGEDEAFGALDREGIAEAVYGALDGDDPQRRARVRARLEQAGLDVEAIQARWVSHPTVGSHLRDCLVVETSRSTGIDRDGAIDTIEWAKARCVGVIERTFDRLSDAGLVDVADREVTVSIRVTCGDCGHSFSARELVADGTHDCPGSRTDPESD